MPSFCLFALLFLMSACADDPDPTTTAISAANRNGGICFADHAFTHYDCADRGMRGISQLVFNTPE